MFSAKVPVSHFAGMNIILQDIDTIGSTCYNEDNRNTDKDKGKDDAP